MQEYSCTAYDQASQRSQVKRRGASRFSPCQPSFTDYSPLHVYPFHQDRMALLMADLSSTLNGQPHSLTAAKRIPRSDLNLGVALTYAETTKSDAVIVTVFPDRMERYFSYKVFEPLNQNTPS